MQMKTKKVTIHDVAKEAGISAATVSYIINNRTDQTISEETKQKVWHVINMLNYKPNTFAKNLRTASENKFIAVCSDFSNELAKAEFFYTFQGLEKAINDKYSLVFTSNPYKRFSNADCILAINLSKDSFYKIGKDNFIPLIAINSYINDKLFFQININFESLKILAEKHFNSDYTFVTIEPNDIQIKEKILSNFSKVIFVNNYLQLDSIKDSNILTIDTCIYKYLSNKDLKVFIPAELSNNKFNKISTCIDQAVSREKFDIHEFEV